MRCIARTGFVLSLLAAAACRANTPVGALSSDAGAPDTTADSARTADTGGAPGGVGGAGGRQAGTGGSTGPDGQFVDASTVSDTSSAPPQDAAVDVPLPAPDAPRAAGPCEGGFLQWARGTSGSGEASVGGVAASPDGTAWVTGDFKGTVTFWAGQPGETTRTASGTDFYLLQVSPDGALLRLVTASNSCRVIGLGVAALGDGSVLVTGGFTNELTIGSSTLMGSASTAMFLARYRASGSPLWAVGSSGPCGSTPLTCGGGDSSCPNYNFGVRVAALSDGRSRVVGPLSGDIRFAGQQVSVPPIGLGGYVAAYSAAGALEWVQSLRVEQNGLALLPDASAIVVGAARVSTSGPTSGQIARFSADGTLLWVKSPIAGDMLRFDARSVAGFSDGSSLIGGSFHDPAVRGIHTPYLARFEGNGDLAWLRSLRARSIDGVPSGFGPSVERLVAAPNGGFVLVATRTRSVDTSGQGVCGRMLSGDSLLLARYDADGAILWARIEGGGHELADRPPDVAVFPDSTTLVGSRFVGPLTLGRGEPNETTLPGRTEPDGPPHAFVAKFGP
jgi:hypothetical protein